MQDEVLSCALKAHVVGRDGEAARFGTDGGSRVGDRWSLAVEDGRVFRHSTMEGMADAVLGPSDEPKGFSYLLLHGCLKYLRRRQLLVADAGVQVDVLKNMVCCRHPVPEPAYPHTSPPIPPPHPLTP